MFSLFAFMYQEDWKYVVFTAIVLGLLLYSLLGNAGYNCTFVQLLRESSEAPQPPSRSRVSWSRDQGIADSGIW